MLERERKRGGRKEGSNVVMKTYSCLGASYVDLPMIRVRWQLDQQQVQEEERKEVKEQEKRSGTRSLPILSILNWITSLDNPHPLTIGLQNTLISKKSI